jgi:isoleucyl-tRNA synthetase
MDKPDLRKKSLEAIDQVTWIPHWGRDRIYGMIENRPDWCVSRQRAWGVPITVFYCEKCEALLLDREIMDKVYTMFEEYGADIWFEKDITDFLPKDAVCRNCGNQSFKKEDDILDVWFDSGVSHAAVLEHRPNLRWPADLYLEGSDQHRGWFHSSLLTAVGTRGRAPYEAVLTHGFVVDADGRKMSKSLGNFIAPNEVIQKYGAEILRLWVTATDYREDIRISENILKQLSDAYRRIRNTSRFMLGNLYDFNPEKDAVDHGSMLEIDRFALHTLQELTQRLRKAYDDYEFHIIYHRLYNYCVLDLSSFYLDILKDRLYISPSASLERRSAQTVLHIIMDTVARLMAPILPFTAEEIWNFMPQLNGKENSIHMAALPVANSDWLNASLSQQWERLLAIRTKALEEARANKLIGHPLDAAVSIFAPEDLYHALLPFENDLRSILIISKASLVNDAKPEGAFASQEVKGLFILVEPAEGEKCERCWIHEPTVGKNSTHPTICSRCLGILDRINA